MTPTTISRFVRTLVAAAALFTPIAAGTAQTPAPAPTPAPALPADPAAARTDASAAERAREMKVLGIPELQPSVTPREIGKPGNANYDEAKANPYPKLPELLVMNDGTKVKTPAQWQKRREEIKAMFDENVYGKYPTNIPKVTWTVDKVEEVTVQGVPAIVKHVVGHVDNSAYPAITVAIHIDVATPASTRGKKVPVIIGGGSVRAFGGLPRPAAPRPAAAPAPAPMPPSATSPMGHGIASPKDPPPDSAKLLLDKGWGFVGRSSNEVQADNGAGLNKGIIGLVNKGQPRKMDDWGVLRAWAWGDARILDYLQTDPDVDGTKVGVMGHSRGGKAALVAEADDSRFAIGYISSSGAGGATLYRRNYGEAMGNITATNEFHWFAGNFLRYAAVGHSANEMPVDSHEFIALIAPRAVFIGGGALYTDPFFIPGDAWQDSQGMFIAAADASPAWELLGAKGLGTTTFPPMGTMLDTGDVAFRQHQYGHIATPNWPYFIEFADKEFKKH